MYLFNILPLSQLMTCARKLNEEHLLKCENLTSSLFPFSTATIFRRMHSLSRLSHDVHHIAQPSSIDYSHLAAGWHASHIRTRKHLPAHAQECRIMKKPHDETQVRKKRKITAPLTSINYVILGVNGSDGRVMTTRSVCVRECVSASASALTIPQ